MCVGFTTGKDIGYTKGIVAATDSDYINGVNDGVETCIDTVLNKVRDNMKQYNIPLVSEKDETL